MGGTNLQETMYFFPKKKHGLVPVPFNQSDPHNLGLRMIRNWLGARTCIQANKPWWEHKKVRPTDWRLFFDAETSDEMLQLEIVLQNFAGGFQYQLLYDWKLAFFVDLLCLV